MQDPGSLDNLRDIVVPAPISWWPLAPGWWFVIAAAIIASSAFTVCAWLRWKRNAYRRAALTELKAAKDDSSVVAILKRTAKVAETQRAESGKTESVSDDARHVGSLTGPQWCGWLAGRSSVPMPPSVQERLSVGVYQNGQQLSPELVRFAGEWIATHRPLASPAAKPQSETTEGHKLT